MEPYLACGSSRGNPGIGKSDDVDVEKLIVTNPPATIGPKPFAMLIPIVIIEFSFARCLVGTVLFVARDILVKYRHVITLIDPMRMLKNTCTNQP